MDEEQKLKKLLTEQDFRESENGNSEILAQKKSLHNPLQKQEMALQSYPTTKKTSATFIQELLAIK